MKLLRRRDTRPEWMRVKPPFPDLSDARACAEYALSPLISDEELAVFDRERSAIRKTIVGACCWYCGTVVPCEIFADEEHPIYREDLDALLEPIRSQCQCQWAREANQS